MDQEQINKLIAQIADEMQAKSRAGIQPLEEEITRMKADVAEVLKSSRDIRRAALQSSNNRPRVDFGPYQGMDRLDLAVSQSILNAGLKNP
ncbi:MAG TPA: hypothetical protein VFA32_15950, partial [Dehalococcoidia bacterium]|nr:hypothetical protein [Dehalococcoidia bacterium]